MWAAQQQWSQWAIQPSMFNNVPHDEIDWAQLAKQWIQMQNQEPSSQSANMPAQGPSFMQDDYAHKQNLSSQMRDSHAETFRPDGKISDVSMDHGGSFQPSDPSGGYWQQNWDVRAAAAADIDERVWTPQVPVDIPAPMLPNEKKTFDYGHVNDAPPLAMQTVDYNHTSEHYGYGPPPPMPPKKVFVPPPPFPMYPAPPPEDMYDQYWSQVAATPMLPATFFKKKQKPVHASSSSSLSAPAPTEEDTSHIDAAKRKQLPAWIREGLEKMEQERLKRLEKERTEKERLEKAKKVSVNKDVLGVANYGDSPTLPSKSKFDSDSERENEDESMQDDDNDATAEEKPDVVKDVSVPFLDLRTEEEKQRDLMLRVRRMLTEVLLTVTTEEMISVAREVYQKALSKAPARPLASSTALRSISTVGLGSLVGYDSQSEASASENEDEDNSTSDEELQSRIQEKKRQFAIKERHILEDLARIEEERRLAVEEDKRRVFEEEKERHKTEDTISEQSNNNTLVNRSEQKEFILNNGDTSLPQPESLYEPSMLRPSAVTPTEFTAELPPQSHELEKQSTEKTQANNSEQDITCMKQNSDRSASKSASDASDSDSNSHSSYSRSSRSDRKSHRSRENRQTRSGKKSKSRYRSSSSHRKQGKHRTSRHSSSDSSKSHNRSKRRRETSRKKSRGKDRDESRSSSTSHSSDRSLSKTSKHKHHDSHNSSDRRRRSWSYDGRSKHGRSRSRSRSSKFNSPDSRHGYYESHRNSSRHHDEDYKRSRKGHKKSHSRSRSRSPPKRYQRKSRSPSYGRGRYIKHSKHYVR